MVTALPIFSGFQKRLRKFLPAIFSEFPSDSQRAQGCLVPRLAPVLHSDEHQVRQSVARGRAEDDAVVPALDLARLFGPQRWHSSRADESAR